jgi:hypothetical protein
MKTMSNAGDQEEITRRFKAIRPASERRWGRMTAHQMVCHLSDGFRLYMGERTAKAGAGRVPREILRWVALWAPLPWPHGFKTLPELDQEAGGTRPVEFEKDMRELLGLIDRFVRLPDEFQWPTHPLFGKMPKRDWMRLGYLHTDHHLRQFGA